MIEQKTNQRSRVGKAIGPDGPVVAVIDPEGEVAWAVLGAPEWRATGLRDRLRAAVLNSGWSWPTGAVHITVPAGLAPDGELAVLVAVLRAGGTDLGGPLDTFRGRVCLDGHLDDAQRCTSFDFVWDLGAMR